LPSRKKAEKYKTDAKKGGKGYYLWSKRTAGKKGGRLNRVGEKDYQSGKEAENLETI